MPRLVRALQWSFLAIFAFSLWVLFIAVQTPRPDDAGLDASQAQRSLADLSMHVVKSRFVSDTLPRVIMGNGARKKNTSSVNKSAFLWESVQDSDSKINAEGLVDQYADSNVTQDIRTDVIFSLLSVLTDVLRNNNIEHWLSNGALLGSFRSEDLIPWDNDADVALTFEEYTRFVSVVTSPAFSWPSDDCLVIFRRGVHSRVIPIKFVNTSNGVYVDLILFFSVELVNILVTQPNATEVTTNGARPPPIYSILREPGLTCYWPYDCATCKGASLQVLESLVYPIRDDCIIRGRNFRCPAQTKAYLLSWYSSLAPRQ